MNREPQKLPLTAITYKFDNCIKCRLVLQLAKIQKRKYVWLFIKDTNHTQHIEATRARARKQR